MDLRPLKAVVAFSAALMTSGAPLLAGAQTSYEFKPFVKGLVVSKTSGAALRLSSKALNFGDVATNASVTRQVQVFNSGTNPVTFSAAPAVNGAPAFASASTSCGAELAVGADCLAEVTFSPTSSGTFNGTLTFTSALAGSPHEVSLVGTAFNPVSLASASLPVARVGVAYSYDFKQLLSVSNEANADKSLAIWDGSGSLPPGLNFDTATGVLSGTPLEVGSESSYTVLATYKNNQGKQVFSIKVGGAILQVRQLAAGSGFTCAILLNNEAQCWGDNSYGQLGDGTAVSSHVPVTVQGLSSGVRHLAAGFRHACAVTLEGGAKCWGYNNSGQLGDGTTTTRLQAVDVTGLMSGVEAIAVSGYGGSNLSHTCAISASGAALCWGSNSSGRLGDGSTSSKRAPSQVVGLTSGVTSISVGGAHSCAVHQGVAKCWGAGDNGRLGNNSLVDRNVPVLVQGLGSDLESISAGGSHTCARSQSNYAWCWGHNSNGQLGDGTTSERRTPVVVSGLGQSVASIQAGYGYSCALSISGGVHCWGRNSDGRLGDGTTTMRTTPTPVLGLSAGVQSIALTAANTEAIGHTCAVLSDGGAQCWGDNSRGQLGDGSTAQRTSPVNVSPN